MKPLSAELKIVLAIVTLFLGWLLAIMIPQDSPIARNWAVRGSWLGQSAPQTSWYLDGQGKLVGNVPDDYSLPLSAGVLRGEQTDMPIKSSHEIAAAHSDGFAVFDSKTRSVSPDGTAPKENRASPAEPTPMEQGGSPFADSLAQAQPTNTTEVRDWEAQGKGLEELQEERKWAKEVQTPVMDVPKFKETKPPAWSDRVATAPPVGLGKGPGSETTSHAKVESAKKTDSPASSELVTPERPKPSSGSIPEVVIKQGEAFADAVDSGVQTAPFTPLALHGRAPNEEANRVAVTRPRQAQAEEVKDTVLADRMPGATPHADPKEEVSGRLVVDPSASGQGWVAPRSLSSASLIRTHVAEGNPVSGANYSTTISKTVRRSPEEIRFPDIRNERLKEPPPLHESKPFAAEPAQRPIIVSLPSSAVPVRIPSPMTPEEFARTRHLDRETYARFCENNRHKLDASGRFPANSLLLIPDGVTGASEL